jgi:tetratricopeptide (TPR) repeat protein
MTRVKTNSILILSCLGLLSGCATSDLKLPFRESIASRWSSIKSNSDDGSKEKLSPEFREAQKILKKDPEGTLLAWARWQEDVGEYGEARKKYRELLIAYPENIEAQLGLARIERSCGRIQQAEEILKTVAKDRPTNAPVRLELGRLYTQQEEWQKAIAAFEDASAIDTENQVCRYELGVAFARSHRFDQALSHLTYAVGSSAANYNIGYVLHEQGNDAEAAEWFQNALQSHPDPTTAEKTRLMLAQLSPRSPGNRNSPPSYPTEIPATSVVANRPRPSTLEQFQPASFAPPVAQTAPTGRVFSSANVLPDATADARQPSQDSGQLTHLPPVSSQPARFESASLSTVQTTSADTHKSFQTVSHSVPKGLAPQSTASNSQLPQWRGTNRLQSEQQVPVSDPSPAKWRGR